MSGPISAAKAASIQPEARTYLRGKGNSQGDDEVKY